jgi:predicted GIY-YIG superfamily endonuclease
MKDNFDVVYVLGLEDDCFYVGWTRDLEKRLAEHKTGKGSKWTKQHKYKELITVLPGDTRLENKIAKKWINRYGYDRVRGGIYISDGEDPIAEYTTDTLTADSVAQLFGAS